MRTLLERAHRTPLLLAALALALYLPGFWWGAPYATAADRTHAWGVDDETPMGAIGQVYHALTHTPEANLGYPLMYYFVATGADMPYLGYLWLTGQVRGIGATYPFGLVDPVRTLQLLTWIPHLVSVLMGVGIVIAAYDAARVLWDRRTGVLTALFAMVSFPMFYYSRTGNVDVPVLFFSAVALDTFAHSITRGFTIRRAAWMGAFVGFALATKETSFAVFLAFPFVLLERQWRATKNAAGWFSPEFLKPALFALLAVILAFGLGSGLFVDPQRYFAHVEFARQRVAELAAGTVAFTSNFPFTWEGNLQLIRLIAGYTVDGMTLAGVLIAIVGVLWTLRREPLPSIFVLPALTYLLVLFSSARAAQLRYLMPVTFVLSFFAARAIFLAWDSRWRVVRAGAVPVALGIIGVGLLQGADLTFAMINDSRYAAAAWLALQTQSGDHVEYFGYTDHLPPLQAGVMTSPAIEFLGVLQKPRLDQVAFEEVKQGWAMRKPRFVITVPDFMSAPGTPYSGACPPQVYAGLLDGSLGYHLVAYFQTPSLFPWLPRPALDYPVVNPPIRVFERESQGPNT